MRVRNIKYFWAWSRWSLAVMSVPMESQTGLGWKDPESSSCSMPCHGQGPSQAAPSAVQARHCHGWGVTFVMVLSVLGKQYPAVANANKVTSSVKYFKLTEMLPHCIPALLGKQIYLGKKKTKKQNRGLPSTGIVALAVHKGLCQSALMTGSFFSF